jgi:hypothetical protein
VPACVCNKQLLHLGLNGRLEKLPGACAQQFSQRLGTTGSTFQFNNVTLVHSGVSLLVDELFGDNKSTRYAASFQSFKHQIQL